MEAWLAQQIDTLFILGIAFVFLVTGYVFGRNSADKPIKAGDKEISYPSETNDEPEGDLFNDAMMDERDERISTL